MKGYALITGAASGIGYAFAKLLASHEYPLILIDLQQNKLDTAIQNLKKEFQTEITGIVQDLTAKDAAQVIYANVRHLPVEILINNAGYGVKGKFSETDWEAEFGILQLQVVTLTQLTKLLLQPMINNKRGKILNIGSMAGFYPGPLMAVYYAVKAYILSFSQAISQELQGTGVTVTVLCPGPTRTKFQQKVGSEQSKLARWNWLDSPQHVVEYGYRAMLKGKRIAIPGVFNRLVIFLARVSTSKVKTVVIRKLQEINKKT